MTLTATSQPDAPHRDSRFQERLKRERQITTKYGRSPLKKEMIARLRREYVLAAKKSRLTVRGGEKLMQVKRILWGLMETKEAERWLSAPNALLGGFCPVDGIKQGNGDRVVEILARVGEGIHA